MHVLTGEFTICLAPRFMIPPISRKNGSGRALADPVVIGAIYRPTGEPSVPAIDDLQEQLTHVLARGKPMFVLGDTNFDVLRPTKPGVEAYLQMLNSLSLKQLITAATHPGANS